MPRTLVGSGMPARYFRGTATMTRAISRTPTTLGMTRSRCSATAMPCSEPLSTMREVPVRSAAMSAAPLSQCAFVQFGEVGVVGGQLRGGRGFDPRALVQDDVGARLVRVGVAVELQPDHAQVEP